MGDSMPEEAKFIECGSVSVGVSDLLRGAIDVPGRIAGASYPAEIWTEGEAESGDGVRCVRRELGQGDLAMRRVDILSQWY